MPEFNAIPVATSLLFGIVLSALKTLSSRLELPMKLLMERKAGEPALPLAGLELFCGVVAVLFLSLSAIYFLAATLSALGAAPTDISAYTYDQTATVVIALGFGVAALHYILSAIRWWRYPQSRTIKQKI